MQNVNNVIRYRHRSRCIIFTPLLLTSSPQWNTINNDFLRITMVDNSQEYRL